jgi:hypothetical protein
MAPFTTTQIEYEHAPASSAGEEEATLSTIAKAASTNGLTIGAADDDDGILDCAALLSLID